MKNVLVVLLLLFTVGICGAAYQQGNIKIDTYLIGSVATMSSSEMRYNSGTDLDENAGFLTNGSTYDEGISQRNVISGPGSAGYSASDKMTSSDTVRSTDSLKSDVASIYDSTLYMESKGAALEDAICKAGELATATNSKTGVTMSGTTTIPGEYPFEETINGHITALSISQATIDGSKVVSDGEFAQSVRGIADGFMTTNLIGGVKVGADKAGNTLNYENQFKAHDFVSGNVTHGYTAKVDWVANSFENMYEDNTTVVNDTTSMIIGNETVVNSSVLNESAK